MSELSVDKITGKTGTGGSNSPLQFSGDTVTLGTGATIGTGAIIGSTPFNASLTSASFPAGHCIKTGYTQVGTVSSYNSSTYTATPLYVDHVAAANGSHIYILCQFNISFNLSTGTGFKILKDGADIGVGTLESGHTSNSPANITFYPHGRGTNYAPDPVCIQVMDTSGSIVKNTTYRFGLYIATLDGNHLLYINRGASWGTGATTTANLSTIYTAEIVQ